MKTRLLFALLLVAATAALAACGGGSSSVPSGAVAVVGSTPVTKAQFDSLMAEAVAGAKASGQPAPTIGTPQYTQLRDRVVAYLVQASELEQQAAKLGVSVSSTDVSKVISNLAKLHYGGSMKKLETALKAVGSTLPQYESQERVNLLAQKVKTKVTASAKVTLAQEKAYYQTNLASYSVSAATTREVAHILVKTKSLATKIEKKLKNGGNFAALAKQYSIDTGSAQNGGKLCIAKSGQSGSCIQTVPPFAKAAFALKTGQISPPVHSQYGWHVIKALGPVTNVKAHTNSFGKEQATIKQALLSQQQSTLWSTWVNNLQKEYQGKVSYQTGYAPATTTTTLPTVPATTTG